MLLSMSMGIKRSFQTMTSRKIAVAASEGAASGRAIRAYSLHSLAPSILPASRISDGSIRIYPVSMKTDTGSSMAVVTITRPARLSDQPSERVSV
ncbi:hypothetical protein D1872_306170 [compost metagenome]